MGDNALLTSFVKHYEHDVVLISGFVALDGSANVLPAKPTNAPPGTGPYTLLKGAQKAIGAGTIITQPHTGTGIYQFTLDNAYFALLGAWVISQDPGATTTIDPFVNANVRANTTSPDAGVQPGTDPTIAAQTVKVSFRIGAGTLTNPPANVGFWLTLLLKRTQVP
jgi:hypothetical protein